MQEFFDEWLPLIQWLFYALIFIISFCRTGSVKSALEALKKEIDMKYRTPDYRENQGDSVDDDGVVTPFRDDYAQTFDNRQTKYVYNRKTKDLEEEPEKVDLQELVNSSRDVALQKVLQQFLPPQTQLDLAQDALTDMQDVLDASMEFKDMLEDYRDKFEMPVEDYSEDDVVNEIRKRSESLKNDLEAFMNKSQKGDTVYAQTSEDVPSKE